MNKFSIINTETSDLNFIYYLFDEAILYQKKKGYPVWPDYDKDVLNNDIASKQQFKIILEDQIACIFSICYSDPIVWRERDNGDAIYLHRIVVNPAYKGQHLFGVILEWVIESIAGKDLQFVRMDTWDKNPDLTNYYKLYGFEIIEHFKTPDSEDLPIQQRNNEVVLMELRI